MKYPIGIQSFERVINEGYVYVDKTDLIYSLVKDGSIYFLSRPRRFGKSLLVSTLENYFLGRRELFKGLKIDGLEREWLGSTRCSMWISTGAISWRRGRWSVSWRDMLKHGCVSMAVIPSGRVWATASPRC